MMQIKNIQLSHIQPCQGCSIVQYSKNYIEDIAEELKHQGHKRVILLKNIGANLYEIGFGVELYLAAQSLGLETIRAVVEE
ncbi:MAG: hypothetical protein SNJ29_16795 [Rikenellaceae bacterium]